MGIRNILFEKFVERLYVELNGLYFHGFKLWDYVNTAAFSRLGMWLNNGLCYELSALAMILMKNHKRARICRGEYYREGGVSTQHSWVEIKIPFNGWWVIDFAWIKYGFDRREAYLKHLNRTGKMVHKWTCLYEDFWDLRIANLIREAMQKPETSHLMLELSIFSFVDKDGGFAECVYEANSLTASDGSIMPPHIVHGTNRPISSEIIRDFVKKPKRRSPKARSIRFANSWIRKYKNWIRQQMRAT